MTRKLFGGVIATILVAAFAFQSPAPAEAMATGGSTGPGCEGPVKRDGSCMTFKEYSKKCRAKGGRPVRDTDHNGRTTWRCEIFINRTQGANTQQPQSVGPHQSAAR